MGITFLTAAVSLMAALSCTDGKVQSGAPVGERSITVEERVEIDFAGGQFSVNAKANFAYEVESYRWLPRFCPPPK